jgi:hypothetical protein
MRIHITMQAMRRVKARNPYARGWISTVDLLELTSSDELPIILKMHIFSFFFTKTSYLMRRSTVLSLPLQ